MSTLSLEVIGIWSGKCNNQIPRKKTVSLLASWLVSLQMIERLKPSEWLLEAMARKGRIGTMVDEHGEGGGDIVVLGLSWLGFSRRWVLQRLDWSQLAMARTLIREHCFYGKCFSWWSQIRIGAWGFCDACILLWHNWAFLDPQPGCTEDESGLWWLHAIR